MKAQQAPRALEFAQRPVSRSRKWRDTRRDPTRALIVHPAFVARAKPASAPRPARARLEEAGGLARAINLQVAGEIVVNVRAPRPATLLGSGKVREIRGTLLALDCDLVIFDSHLTPGQQRNLERAWNIKVLDRTGLILEIFASRAQSREGRLQVELAQLSYQKSRLVRSWTHLERQRGALGFVGGPGETQKEADRRMIQTRIARIERELKTVTRTRALHRASRQRVPYPVIALIGYTNAGKSTLFNHLTKAGVKAEDLLFATLDPTMRGIDLPGGRRAIISDTVGFISDLPTQLVAAFRATLEEVIEADLLIHVRDVSHADNEAQAGDVEQILGDLGLGDTQQRKILEVWSKIDLVSGDERTRIVNLASRNENAIVISARTGEGLDTLRARVEDVLARHDDTLELVLDAGNGEAVSWLHEHCDVLARDDDGEGRLAISVRLSESRKGAFYRRFGDTLGPRRIL